MSFTLLWFLVFQLWARKCAFITMWSSAGPAGSFWFPRDASWCDIFNLKDDFLFIFCQLWEAGVMVAIYYIIICSTDVIILQTAASQWECLNFKYRVSRNVHYWESRQLPFIFSLVYYSSLFLFYLFRFCQSLAWLVSSFRSSKRSHNKTSHFCQFMQGSKCRVETHFLCANSRRNCIFLDDKSHPSWQWKVNLAFCVSTRDVDATISTWAIQCIQMTTIINYTKMNVYIYLQCLYVIIRQQKSTIITAPCMLNETERKKLFIQL